MTRQNVYESIKNHYSLTSSEMFYDSKNNISIPKFAVVEVMNDNSQKMYQYFHYNENAEVFSLRTFVGDENLYISYLVNYRTEMLQDMVDKGTLYRDVRKILRRVDKAVSAQAEKWAHDDQELNLALKEGNMHRYHKLFSGLKNAAREEIYSTMLYV